MKAFLVNRVGDFGFILGIGLLVAYTGSMNYAEVFAKKDSLAVDVASTDWMLITVVCICLFVGAMGKSAQFRCTSGCQIRWKVQLNFRADSRGDYGDGRYLHGDTHVAIVRKYPIRL